MFAKAGAIIMLPIFMMGSGGGGGGCSSITGPKFKVGDCIKYKNEESWEKHKVVFKIKSVGKKKYLTEWVIPEHMKGKEDTESFVWDDIFEKTECPNE